MKAGRELDALIAEKVMGLIAYKVQLVAPPPRVRTMEELQRIGVPLPRYSTNIADAWAVVEKLISTPGPNGDHHSVQVDYSGDAVVVIDEHEDWRVSAIADTVELAICLAALKAKGVMGEQHE